MFHRFYCMTYWRLLLCTQCVKYSAAIVLLLDTTLQGNRFKINFTTEYTEDTEFRFF